MTTNESRPADARNGSHQVGGPTRRVTARRVSGCQEIDLRRFVDDDAWLDLGLKCPPYYVPDGVEVRVLIGDAVGATAVERLSGDLAHAARVKVVGSSALGISAVVAALRPFVEVS